MESQKPNLSRMPHVSPRRPYDEETFGGGYLESLDDWYANNWEAVEWFLENADAIRSLIRVG
jgi:hypothetical protein